MLNLRLSLRFRQTDPIIGFSDQNHFLRLDAENLRGWFVGVVHQMSVINTKKPQELA